MRPKSFSASALHVAELCMARYKAEQIDRGRGMGGAAATLGSAVHGALEAYVKEVYLNKTHEPNFQRLIDLYVVSYMTEFHTANPTGDAFEDGADLLKKWYKRNDLGVEGRRVISAEVKTNFPIPVVIDGQKVDIPFNYIWDRFDEMSPGVYRVVDYKTNAWALNPADLKNKLQARCYALALAIQLKKEGIEAPDRIWVEFDMLRHDGPVGYGYSRAEIAATWKFIKELAQTIIDLPDDEVDETLNSECLFCVRKASCTALQKNLAVGGIMRITSAEQAIDLRAALEFQIKGINSLIRDLDTVILTDARERDEFEFETDLNRMAIVVSSRRSVDAEMVERAIGPALFDKYGGKSFTIASVEKLLKGKELTDQQRRDLSGLIYQKKGEPSVKIFPKNAIDD